jgi:hypothetical protein
MSARIQRSRQLESQLLTTGRCAFPEPNTLKTHIGDFAQIELANTFTDLARVSGLLPKTPFSGNGPGGIG